MDAGNPWAAGYFLPICNSSGVDIYSRPQDNQLNFSSTQFPMDDENPYWPQLSFLKDNIR